jgi:glucose/mannose transport system substrate-binding protein
MRGRILAAAMLALGALAGAARADQPTAEVLHWWTSGGEAKALKVIVDRFKAEGGNYIDNPVAGGGGDAARTVAKTRMLGGNPPTLMQWHLGLSLKQLAEDGLLGDIESVAAKDHWDASFPALIWSNAKVGGKYVAIPVGVHGENWLWTNTKVLAAAGVAVPKTWDEFNAAAAKIAAAGYIPLALGGQDWQETIVFADIVLGLGGPDLFRAALVKLDDAAYGSATMLAVFVELAKIRRMMDPGAGNRSWNETTNLVITGKAAMQFMGDWAKGEFSAAGMKPGADYGCALAPGSGDAYSIAADSFAVPRVTAPDQRAGQELMAHVIMEPAVQRDFSLAKGSVPPRKDVPFDGFDQCSRIAMNLLRGSENLLPSLGSGMGVPPVQGGAISDAIAAFFARKMTPEQGVKTLREAVAAVR